MPPALFERYQKDPLGMDEEVRQVMNVPDERYYCVSIWPVGGILTVDATRTRVVRAEKISKSRQPGSSGS